MSGEIQSWLATLTQIGGLAFLIWRTMKAERAAVTAAAHAADTRIAVAVVDAKVEKIDNGMRTALNEAQARADRLEGREEMRAETEAKTGG